MLQMHKLKDKKFKGEFEILIPLYFILSDF